MTTTRASCWDSGEAASLAAADAVTAGAAAGVRAAARVRVGGKDVTGEAGAAAEGDERTP